MLFRAYIVTMLSISKAMFLCTYKSTSALNLFSPTELLRKDFTNLSDEFALSTPHEVTDVMRRRCSIFVMFGSTELKEFLAIIITTRCT